MRTALHAVLFIVATCLAACASEASYIKRGQELAAQGRPDAAIEQLMTVLGENPDSWPAHFALGRVYLDLGRLDDALKAFELARKGGDAPELLAALASAYGRKHDGNRAAMFMEQAVKADPQNAANHLRLGIARQQLGDWTLAIEAYRAALTIDPTIAEARVRLGLGLKEQKRIDEALATLKAAVGELRGTGRAYAAAQEALAETYEAAGMLDYALHTYRLTIKVEPNMLPALLGASRVLRAKGQPELAIETLVQAARTLASEPSLFLELGLAYRDYHLDEQAIEAFTKALALPPSAPLAYAPLVDLLIQTKAPAAQVSRLIEQGLAALPADPDLHMRSGDLALSKNAVAQAIEEYRRVTGLQPGNADALYKLGAAQADSGDLAGAKESSRSLRILDAAKATTLDALIDKAAVAPAPPPPPTDAVKPPPATRPDRGKNKKKSKKRGGKRGR